MCVCVCVCDRETVKVAGERGVTMLWQRCIARLHYWSNEDGDLQSHRLRCWSLFVRFARVLHTLSFSGIQVRARGSTPSLTHSPLCWGMADRRVVCIIFAFLHAVFGFGIGSDSFCWEQPRTQERLPSHAESSQISLANSDGQKAYCKAKSRQILHWCCIIVDFRLPHLFQTEGLYGQVLYPQSCSLSGVDS